MPNTEIDLLAVDRGTVTAPAGCGKTHLITEALSRHSGAKPILVLTHTNAGVAALRQRLNRAGVSPKAYVLSTIDGWAMRLISTFPARSGHDPELLNLASPRTDYPQIRDAAVALIEADHLNDVIEASYARLIVDEYQDCSIRQHALVTNAARVLPTCVLGDPMQAIFGFRGVRLAKWAEHVCTSFPPVGELNKPWRWINADAEPLGLWLRDVRSELLSRKVVDIRTAPAAVTWVELDGTHDYQRRLAAARTRPPGGAGSVLIIGESANAKSRHRLASQTPGAVAVDAVDMEDLTAFAQTFDPTAADALENLVGFAKGTMTNVGAANIVSRVNSLIRGTARKPPTDVEHVALVFVRAPSYQAAQELLMELRRQHGVHAYRPAVLRACIKALELCEGTDGLSFYDAVMKVREQNRLVGRLLPARSVCSTLLLKGLEAQVAVILNASSLDARNLYVAMTRGSRALVVCSRTPILRPVW